MTYKFKKLNSKQGKREKGEKGDLSRAMFYSISVKGSYVLLTFLKFTDL